MSLLQANTERPKLSPKEEEKRRQGEDDGRSTKTTKKKTKERRGGRRRRRKNSNFPRLDNPNYDEIVNNRKFFRPVSFQYDASKDWGRLYPEFVISGLVIDEIHYYRIRYSRNSLPPRPAAADLSHRRNSLKAGIRSARRRNSRSLFGAPRLTTDPKENDSTRMRAIAYHCCTILLCILITCMYLIFLLQVCIGILIFLSGLYMTFTVFCDFL